MILRYLLAGLLAAGLSGCGFDESTLQIGVKVPSMRTKTLADVNGDFSRITSYRYPDKRMYKWSLDDALKTHKPIVLIFATPGHCTQCDQHLQIMKAILDKYGDKFLFLHMDQYENPGAFKAFRVMGDPWTFVIDSHNIVKFKRAGRILFREMDMELAKVLKQEKSTS
jgi:thiol-disulfide isomerase/thioredoxin